MKQVTTKQKVFNVLEQVAEKVGLDNLLKNIEFKARLNNGFCYHFSSDITDHTNKETLARYVREWRRIKKTQVIKSEKYGNITVIPE